MNIKENMLIIVDEAHNFGATNASEYLDDKIPYDVKDLSKLCDDIDFEKID